MVDRLVDLQLPELLGEDEGGLVVEVPVPVEELRPVKGFRITILPCLQEVFRYSPDGEVDLQGIRVREPEEFARVPEREGRGTSPRS